MPEIAHSLQARMRERAIHRKRTAIEGERESLNTVWLGQLMVSHNSQPLEQSQRILVEMERHRQGKLVKIRVEHYDECLGWYTSGSLSLSLRQLPLIEQAVKEMRECESSEAPLSEKIIPFPGSMDPSAG